MESQITQVNATKVSLLERSSWHDPPPEWGRTKTFQGNWPPNLIRPSMTFPCECMTLTSMRSHRCPDCSGRVSQQLLLLITETSDAPWNTLTAWPKIRRKKDFAIETTTYSFSRRAIRYNMISGENNVCLIQHVLSLLLYRSVPWR